MQTQKEAIIKEVRKYSDIKDYVNKILIEGYYVWSGSNFLPEIQREEMLRDTIRSLLSNTDLFNMVDSVSASEFAHFEEMLKKKMESDEELKRQYKVLCIILSTEFFDVEEVLGRFITLVKVISQ